MHPDHRTQRSLRRRARCCARQAEQITDNGELEPIAEAFATKYGSEIWDFVVRDGAFSHRGADGRALVFRGRPVRGLGFRKGGLFSQTTWHFPG